MTEDGKEYHRGRPANSEMIQGFSDGYDLDAPEPNENRSHSYRHGFMAGRNDKLPNDQKLFRLMLMEDVLKMADEAMARDDADSGYTSVTGGADSPG